MDRTRTLTRTLSASALLCFTFGFYNLSTAYGNAEGDALNALKTQLTDPNNVLQSWDPTLVNPCTWSNVTCNDENSVVRIDLGNANLSGQLVPQLGQLTNLQYLELFNNNITGSIPSELGNLTSLVSLDLYLNRLEGVIPDTLGNLNKLLYLRLNNNTLTGTIPVSLTSIDSLQLLDLSNNLLRGDVPKNGSFSNFTIISFANNPELGTSGVVPAGPASSQSPSISNAATAAIVGGIAVGAAALLFVIAWWCYKKWQYHFVDLPAEEDPKVHPRQVKRFSLNELQVATNYFSTTKIIGQRGFGKVYKGRLTDGSLVAVKRLDVCIQGGELQFQIEVKMISMAVHRNLLQLRGFCMTPTERLLVYPYMANGSVASCLWVDRRDTQVALDWPIRKRIALGSARGLAYLHNRCNPKIIHGDVKAANILLDDEFEAVVGDFGLAKLVDYIVPEYLSTGRCSEKTDVFGYGVMLLELVTGKRTFDLGHIANNDDEAMLLDWVKEVLWDKKLVTLVDANLEGNYVDDEVEQLIQVARLCTQSRASERPKMSEVVRMLEGEGLAERWKEWQKEEIFRQDFRQTHNPNTVWIMTHSHYNVSNDQLSGPR